jgi:hypothetical protein
MLITFLGSMLFVYRSGSADITVDLKQSSLHPTSGRNTFNLLTSPAYSRDLFGNDENDDDKTLRYTYSKVDNRITLTPELKYLESQRRGEPVTGFFWSHDPFKWDFPSLSVKVVNNTHRDLVLGEVVFRVKSSVKDDRPVFAVFPGAYLGIIGIDNEGWGVITSPSLHVSIKGVDKCDTFDLKDAVQLPLKRSADSDVDSNTFDKYGGVTTSILSLARAENLRSEACVHGRLDFVDQDGHAGFLNFSTISNLGGPPAPTVGAAMPPSFSYDVFLKAGKSNYVQRLSISQQIKPGEGDNFSLKLAADRSATFDFDMDILAVDGSVAWTGSFNVVLLVPQSGARRATQNTTIRTTKQ